MPPESAPRAGLRAAAAHVELADQRAGALDQAAREEPAEPGSRRSVVVVQRDVLREAELEHQAAMLAILRNVADARVEHVARAAVRDLLAGDPDRARPGLAQAGDRVDQLGLPVAVHARDPDDLARVHLERDAAHLLDPAVVDDVQVLDLEQRLAGLRGRLLHPQQHLAPDHQPREPRLGRTCGRHASRSSSRAGAP